MDKYDLLTIRDTFKHFLTEKALRTTETRMAVLEAVLTFNSHFTAEELLNKARSINSKSSRASIYRTIPILLESKIIREIDIGKDHKYYKLENNSQNFKAQVICSNCDKIFEIEAPFMEWYGKAVADKYNLDATSYKLQITAKCSKKFCDFAQ